MACYTPYTVEVKYKRFHVPCGKCPACRHRRVNDWVFRLMQEDEVSVTSHFVTLTYNTDHVPISKNGYMTLEKTDLQKYFKRLRKMLPKNNERVRYYAVGEYGGKTSRPHYHMIMFNVPDENMFFDAWHLDGKPLGTVHVGKVSGNSVAYTMKYMDKPRRKPEHARDDRAPEFALMSKGIGQTYVHDYSMDWHNQDIGRLYCVKPDGRKIAMPKYYRNMIYDEKDRKAQPDIVVAATYLAEQDARRRHTGALSYDETVESEKLNRWKKFFNNHAQKNRYL